MQHMTSYFHENNIQTFERTSAIFRLGRKYEIDHLRDDALKRLNDELPSSLGARDQLRFRRRIMFSRGSIIECINLARSEGMLKFLPFSFARLNTFPASTLLVGVKRLDGTHGILSPEDQHISISGIELLRAAVVEEMFGWVVIDKSLPGSCQRSSCSEAKYKKAIALLKPPHLTKQLPLGVWESSWEEGLCPVCITAAKEAYEAGRMRVWGKLPSFFKLPEWKVILKDVDGMYLKSLLSVSRANYLSSES
jgi:hypothetical protein